ncbi:MAG: hypothetical protein Q7J31_00375 [Syntrophales bacterium]|nr:hypothetical protein [Syntrophales bacterium]
MNDTREFKYARNVVYEALDEVSGRYDLPNVTQSLVAYISKYLDKSLSDTTEISSAYCACLTVSPDHPEQWETYAEHGRGFAIGLNLRQFLDMQVPAVQRGQPFVFCAPVNYNQRDQHDLVWRLVEAGICDLQTFSATCSQQSGHLTALLDRVTKEIVDCLLPLMDFIKAPIYKNEREMRLILDPNDGTLKAHHVQYSKRDNESMPFIFMDLCNPKTRRLPLAEIKVGPKTSFHEEKSFIEDLLDKIGYMSNYDDQPQVTQSLLTV